MGSQLLSTGRASVQTWLAFHCWVGWGLGEHTASEHSSMRVGGFLARVQGAGGALMVLE